MSPQSPKHPRPTHTPVSGRARERRGRIQPSPLLAPPTIPPVLRRVPTFPRCVGCFWSTAWVRGVLKQISSFHFSTSTPTKPRSFKLQELVKFAPTPCSDRINFYYYKEINFHQISTNIFFSVIFKELNFECDNKHTIEFTHLVFSLFTIFILFIKIKSIITDCCWCEGKKSITILITQKIIAFSRFFS